MQESNNRISFDKELKQAIKDTITPLAKAVKGTLGPLGTNVGVLSSISRPVIVNDGVTVIKAVKFENPLHNYLSQLFKTASSETDVLAGDGTTTATVLMEAIIVNGLKYIEANFSTIDVVRGIKKATNEILKELENKTVDLEGNLDLLKHVASISANNDSELGDLIAEAFNKVGVDGQIEIKNSNSSETYTGDIEGMKYDVGFESNMFSNTNNGSVLLEDCNILIYEGKLKTLQHILPILQDVYLNNESLLIIADDYSPEALNDLTSNKVQQGLKLCAVKSPGYGVEKEKNLNDIALITNTSIVSRRFGFEIDQVDLSFLGKSSTVKVDNKSFTVLSSNDNENKVSEKIKELKEKLPELSELEKKEVLKRIARISNGVSVLYIGGSSPTDIAEKYYRAEDAINATRASLKEGIVPGGGISLLKLSKSVSVDTENEGELMGSRALLQALEAPITTICENAGVESSITKKEVLTGDFNYGYNAKTQEFGDLIELGVIDPKRVTKNALLQASSLSQMILSMNCVIY